MPTNKTQRNNLKEQVATPIKTQTSKPKGQSLSSKEKSSANNPEKQTSAPEEQNSLTDDTEDSLADGAEDKNSEQATSDELTYFKSHPIKTKTPDFVAISDVKERKSTFFNYLVPFINEKNAIILQEREHIQSILGSKKGLTGITTTDANWLSIQRKNYKLEPLEKHTKDSVLELMNRLDIIPTSLVLAQAANESAWGTSRFAVDGNNYFGQWCFKKGCGLVPESRDDNASHEVRKFNNARESVFAYIDNLNTNNAYKKLRASRIKLRKEGKNITGLALVQGLKHYSARGQAYIDEIEELIEYNELWRFNKVPQKPKDNS